MPPTAATTHTTSGSDLEGVLFDTAHSESRARPLTNIGEATAQGITSPFGNRPTVAEFEELDVQEMIAVLEQKAFRLGGSFNVDLKNLAEGRDFTITIANPKTSDVVRLLVERQPDGGQALLKGNILPSIYADSSIVAGMSYLLQNVKDVQIKNESTGRVCKLTDVAGNVVADSAANRNAHIETLTSLRDKYPTIDNSERLSPAETRAVAKIAADLFRGRESATVYAGDVADRISENPQVVRRYDRDPNTFSEMRNELNARYVGTKEIRTENGTTLKFKLPEELTAVSGKTMVRFLQEFITENGGRLDLETRGRDIRAVAAELRVKSVDLILSKPELLQKLQERFPEVLLELGDKLDSPAAMQAAEKRNQIEREVGLKRLESRLGAEEMARIKALDPIARDAELAAHKIKKEWSSLTTEERSTLCKQGLAEELSKQQIYFSIRKEFCEKLDDAFARETIPTEIRGRGQKLIGDLRLTEVWQTLMSDKAMFSLFSPGMERSNYVIDNSLRNPQAALNYLRDHWERIGVGDRSKAVAVTSKSGPISDVDVDGDAVLKTVRRERPDSINIAPAQAEILRRFETPFHWSGADISNGKVKEAREIGVDYIQTNCSGTVFSKCSIWRSNARDADFSEVSFKDGTSIGQIMFHRTNLARSYFADDTRFTGLVDLSGANGVPKIPVMRATLDFDEQVRNTPLFNFFNGATWLFFGIHPMSAILRGHQKRISATAGLIAWNSDTDFDGEGKRFVELAAHVNCLDNPPQFLLARFADMTRKSPEAAMKDMVGSLGLIDIDVVDQITRGGLKFRSDSGSAYVGVSPDSSRGKVEFKMLVSSGGNETALFSDSFNLVDSALALAKGRSPRPISLYDSLAVPKPSAEKEEDGKSPKIKGRARDASGTDPVGYGPFSNPNYVDMDS